MRAANPRPRHGEPLRAGAVRNPDLNTHTPPELAVTSKVPFVQFFILTFLQTALALFVFHWISPGTYRAETQHPGMIVFWTLFFGLPLSLFEYMYHRYLLHSAIFPFLRSMHRAHSHHHGLTSVKAPVTPKEPALLVPVANEYPVVHEHQEEDMMFPVYAISIFQVLFFVFFGLPFKWIFSGQPIFFSLILSVTAYYSWYELWHAIMHLPYDRFWRPLMEGRRTGRIVRHVYGFHLMHHWRPTANLAVVGLWGYAVWDHLFRTHHRPKRIPLAGAEVSFSDADMKRPRWPVATLDRWQASLFRWSRAIEDWGARTFLRRSPKS